MPAKNNVPRTLTHKGRTLTLEAWASETGIPEPTIRSRLDRLGWAVADALTTPPAKKHARAGRPRVDGVRSVPPLKRHAAGQAYVKWGQGGRRHYRYFGAWGSSEARAGYATFVTEWATLIGSSTPPVDQEKGISVGGLVGKWLDRCQERYRKLGKVTSEYHCQRSACAVWVARHGALPLADFGLNELEQVRRDMIAKGWARKSINKNVGRIVAAVGWAVPRKLCSAEVHFNLTQIDTLVAGGSEAIETEPVRSVPAEHVVTVLAGDHLHPDPAKRAILAAMIRVQLLTGMRPGSLVSMRPELVDRSGKEWKYVPSGGGNKNYHRDMDLVVWFGPLAQKILAPFLDGAAPGEPVFRFARQRKVHLKWRAISRADYGRLIAEACARAQIPPWTPHQLRHNRATEIKRRYESDEAAARAIGTSPDVAARIYVDPQEIVDRRIARETG